eukprot:2190110-Amphidinium_carterae.1
MRHRNLHQFKHHRNHDRQNSDLTASLTYAGVGVQFVPGQRQEGVIITRATSRPNHSDGLHLHQRSVTDGAVIVQAKGADAHAVKMVGWHWTTTVYGSTCQSGSKSLRIAA